MHGIFFLQQSIQSHHPLFELLMAESIHSVEWIVIVHLISVHQNEDVADNEMAESFLQERK